MKLLKELYNKYFSLNLNDYPNIGVDLEINKLLFFVFIGICVACFIINYNQSNIALLLKRLMRAEAFSEENSKTLGELGLADNKSVKNLISKDSGIIKKVVSVVGKRKMTYEEYIESENQRKAAKRMKNAPSAENSSSDISSEGSSFDNMDSVKLYIAPDMKDYAEHTFENNNGSIIKTALYCILIFAFYLALVFIMPSLLDAVNSILS